MADLWKQGECEETTGNKQKRPLMTQEARLDLMYAVGGVL